MSGPQNSAEVAQAIGPTLDLFVKNAAPAIQRATEQIYERLLYDVQDYLRDNAVWNLGAEIDRCRKVEAENRELRTSQAELVEALRADLGEYDAVVKVCPANKTFLGDKLCPKCKAGPDKGCGEEIVASAQFISSVRNILAKIEGDA